MIDLSTPRGRKKAFWRPGLFGLLVGMWIFLILPEPAAARSRILDPTPGAVLAKNLPEDFSARVTSITYNIYDAFEGSKINTPAEAQLFDLGNKLHIESKKSTIHRRIIFDVDEIVDREILLESEKLLRSEQFLADAMIEVRALTGGTCEIFINTFDQFTTSPALGLERPGGEWTYMAGMFESNFMGTGQRIGALFAKTIDRNTYLGQYENKAFLVRNLTLSGGAGVSTDGYQYDYYLGRPLISNSQQYAYHFSGEVFKSSRYFYLDSDLPGIPQDKMGEPKALYGYSGIVSQEFNGSFTKSMGKKDKFNISALFQRREKYRDGSLDGYIVPFPGWDATAYFNEDPYSQYDLDFRLDNLLGLSFSYYQNDYKTVRNFRNVKWSEDVVVGFRVTNSVFQNLEILGAHNSDLNLSHTLVYLNIWDSKHILNTSLSSSYFLGYDGRF